VIGCAAETVRSRSGREIADLPQVESSRARTCLGAAVPEVGGRSIAPGMPTLNAFIENIDGHLRDAPLDVTTFASPPTRVAHTAAHARDPVARLPW